MDLETRQIFINSLYNNIQTDTEGSEYSASLINPIKTDDEHTDIYLALQQFSFYNVFYNVEEEDRLVFKLHSNYNGFHYTKYVEVYIPEGNYTISDIVDNWGSFSAYNHGTYFGSKPTTWTATVNGTVNGTSTQLKWIQDEPALPTTISYSSTKNKVYFDWTNVTNHGEWTVTTMTVVATGANDDNLIRHLGFMAPIGASDTYVLTRTITANTGSDVGTYPLSVSGSATATYMVNLQAYSSLYLHLENTTGSNCTSADNFQMSDVLCVVPVYTSFNYPQSYSPQELTWLRIQDGRLANFRMKITDSDGYKVNFQGQPWHVTFCWRSGQPFDYTSTAQDNQRNALPITFSGKQSNDPLFSSVDNQQNGGYTFTQNKFHRSRF